MVDEQDAFDGIDEMDDVDLLLESAFQQPNVTDADFVATVMTRVTRQRRMRAVILSAAAVVGAVIALPQAMDVLTLVQSALAGTAQTTGLVAAALIGLGLPLGLILADE